jgi:hypothetical protein
MDHPAVLEIDDRDECEILSHDIVMDKLAA